MVTWNRYQLKQKKVFFFFYNYYTFSFISFFFSALEYTLATHMWMDVFTRECLLFFMSEEKLDFYLIQY